MQYHNITKDDMLNGDGLRVVLWVAGCGHACPGCHNPITWDAEGGLLFDQAAKAELFTELGKDYISGITFSGGDPLSPATARRSVSCAARFGKSFRIRPSGCIPATVGRKSSGCRFLIRLTC